MPLTETAPPPPVRRAFVLWTVAVAAGAFETVLAVGGMVADGSGTGTEIAIGLAVRLTVFTAALLIALRMRGGHAWARVALAVGLGVVGTASMVAEPLRALAGGASPGTSLAEAGVMDLLFGGSRVLHVAAVLVATVLMFAPAANNYFRTCRTDRVARRTPGRTGVFRPGRPGVG